jgi:hypothetical protein
VSPRLDAGELRFRLGELDPEFPMDAHAAIEWSTNLMEESMVHTTSPARRRPLHRVRRGPK